MTNLTPTFELRVTPRALMPPQIEIFQITSTTPFYACTYILTVFEVEDMDLPPQAQRMIAKLESDLGVALGLQEPEYHEVDGYEALEEIVMRLTQHPAIGEELEAIRRQIIEQTLERVRQKIGSEPQGDSFPGQYL